MPVIKLQTKIKANKDEVFDLARSIEIHEVSAEQTNEKAISGRTSGFIKLNETVTWRAKHFGIYHTLTVKITEFNRPEHFADTMISGIFKNFRHDHYFNQIDDTTDMIDVFDYTAPFGFLGRIANFIFLKKYMLRFLKKRNMFIKKKAEQCLKAQV